MVQDLGYTRDAVEVSDPELPDRGNITAIRDAARETVFFNNAQVSANRSFAYDSPYRPSSATGRERAPQSQSTAFCSGYARSLGSIPDCGPPALRNYIQRKVWNKESVVEGRISLGDHELWRKKNSAGVVQDERQTLHVMDDSRRIVIVETLTITGRAVGTTDGARSAETETLLPEPSGSR